ncbi:MAG: hypothetical protein RLZZ428_1054 [Pseudomonadota bacterium]
MKYIILALLLSFGLFANSDLDNTFMCEFTKVATEKGSQSSEPLRFTIMTNDTNGTYTLKANDTISTGNIIKAPQGISFVQVTKMGNITTTTMTQISPLDGEQKAAYSRNVILNGALMASQYYGTCKIVDKVKTNKTHFVISPEKSAQIARNLHLKSVLQKLPSKDVKYVEDALKGIFPSRLEMEEDMSIEGMILISKIMDQATK